MKQKKTELKSRFIPVYTGNTGSLLHRYPHVPVHPRIHGEHGIRNIRQQHQAGSSPYTRGTQYPEKPEQSLTRFIPVYTGNTLNSPLSKWSKAVHPRIHGEHSNYIHLILLNKKIYLFLPKIIHLLYMA